MPNTADLVTWLPIANSAIILVHLLVTFVILSRKQAPMTARQYNRLVSRLDLFERQNQELVQRMDGFEADAIRNEKRQAEYRRTSLDVEHAQLREIKQQTLMLEGLGRRMNYIQETVAKIPCATAQNEVGLQVADSCPGDPVKED